MATQAGPDLIVMVSLRDIEGSEATRTLKAPTQTAHILIVMLTVPAMAEEPARPSPPAATTMTPRRWILST